MKRTLTKDWHFNSYGGPDCYKAGMVVSGKRHKDGLLKEHFYCYGQNEIIPNEYFAPPSVQPASDLFNAMRGVVAGASKRKTRVS